MLLAGMLVSSKMHVEFVFPNERLLTNGALVYVSKLLVLLKTALLCERFKSN